MTTGGTKNDGESFSALPEAAWEGGRWRERGSGGRGVPVTLPSWQL